MMLGWFRTPGRLRLLLEAAKPVRVLRERRGQDLDRDLAPEPRILRPVDLTHPSGADLAEDLVGAELGAGRQSHRASRPSTMKSSDSKRE